MTKAASKMGNSQEKLRGCLETVHVCALRVNPGQECSGRGTGELWCAWQDPTKSAITVCVFPANCDLLLVFNFTGVLFEVFQQA